MTARALALLLLLAAPCYAQTTPLAVYVAASAVDWSTTTYLLQHGYREGNPAARWLTETPQRAAVGKVITATVIITAVREMKRQGHPKAARIVAWTVAAAQVAIAVRGARQVREVKR